MAEHHYIVKFDDVTKTWSQDTDSEEVRFPDGTIWDEKKNDWEFPYQGDGKFYRNADAIDELLSIAIEGMNE